MSNATKFAEEAVDAAENSSNDTAFDALKARAENLEPEDFDEIHMLLEEASTLSALKKAGYI